MSNDLQKVRENRKNEHVRLALSEKPEMESHFDQLFFVHHSLPRSNYDQIDLHTELPDFQLSSPLYINAMTGGSEMTGRINADLAEIASATKMAMAVGSQHAGLRNEQVVSTYQVVRQKNPDGIIFANVGADVPPELAVKAVEMLEANALQVHLNVPQELVMPEGERNFSHWLQQIEKMIKEVDVPVIVKEVGFGMSRETIKMLLEIGVSYVDLGGRGGTNFISIENRRREKQEYQYLRNWGQTTPISLLEAQPYLDRVTIFASGGVRNPLDVVKCLSLGAKAVGIASPILRMLQEKGVEYAIDEMREWHLQIQTICTMLGAVNLAQLQNCPLVITAEVRQWCEARGIEISSIAQRSDKGDTISYS